MITTNVDIYLRLQVLEFLSMSSSVGVVIYVFQCWSCYLCLQVLELLSMSSSDGVVIYVFKCWSCYLCLQVMEFSYFPLFYSKLDPPTLFLQYSKSVHLNVSHDVVQLTISQTVGHHIWSYVYCNFFLE